MSENDRFFMELALDEARKGLGRTAPNPCVGALIVRDGHIVGRGYHKRAGTPHAEVHALADAGAAARGATMYVTLEPCNHTGRTPPCSHAVVAAGLSRVVIGLSDPNPLARGGAEYLLAHGIEVTKGVCERECRILNLPFIKHTTTGTPWVVMKAGMSLDGRITYRKGQGGAVTGRAANQAVHNLRDQMDAILIGVETAEIDNPSLTTRLANREGRDPLRVILDSRLRIAPDSTLFVQDSPAETWIFCTHEASIEKESVLRQAGAVVKRVAATSRNHVDLAEVLSVLGRNNILSILVEGGAGVHGSFLRHGLFDEAYLFIAPFFIGDAGTPLVQGYSAASADSALHLVDVSLEQLGTDNLIHGFFQDQPR
ncbi:MAG TPA: bifunctional diaminohydroxyphosphoribosylaminopyrimidine deaminase/5-amino-6-(5-phosphoribosylamino)uracil reductase RibD [Desulfobulbus sp.]|nr:bifunctional diaminohydroxyphosphoribosylaminopyrimidine deaminase/5-amino-6-(5-phosphoribosylamino)uracil reductase RibD [Desulfobulbus sp.]